MTDAVLVTTFHTERHWKDHAERMAKSWKTYNSHIPLIAYYEGEKPKFDGPIWHDIEETQFPKVRARWAGLPAAHGIVGKRVVDYRRQALRFAPKVAAIAAGPNGVYYDTTWLIWVDADVEFVAPLDQAFWLALEGFARPCVTLLRTDIWNCAETGFVAFAWRHPSARQIVTQWWRLYESGDIFLYPEWHDAYALSSIGWQFPYLFADLSGGLGKAHGLHPWPLTILGEYMIHHKGPNKNG